MARISLEETYFYYPEYDNGKNFDKNLEEIMENIKALLIGQMKNGNLHYNIRVSMPNSVFEGAHVDVSAVNEVKDLIEKGKSENEELKNMQMVPVSVDVDGAPLYKRMGDIHN